MEAGCRLEAATFLGGLAVGVISAWMARSRKMPVAVIAFAGAVTMIPGLHIYRALGGALRLARLGEMTDPGTVALTFGNAYKGASWSADWHWGSSLGSERCEHWPGSETSS